MMTQHGHVISLGQIIVDIPLRIDALPEPGGDTFAKASSIQVGASFNTLFAARQMGADASWAGVCGTGQFADLIMQTIEQHHIHHIGKRDSTRDSGFCVALTDAHAERTFISTRGAEAYGERNAFDCVQPQTNNVVHISGYTLAHPLRSALLAFLDRTHNRQFTAIFDPSPIIASVDQTTLNTFIDYHPLWSCNEREALLLAQRLHLCSQDESNISESLIIRLQRALDTTLIVRVGSKGAWVCQTNTMPQLIASFPVHAIDTNGAGDAHTGVLAALLSEGIEIIQATRYANAAAAIAVSKIGPATCPSRTTIEQLLCTK